jgi:ribosomal protein RSM22 (predicted rRNA methylase)
MQWLSSPSSGPISGRKVFSMRAQGRVRFCGPPPIAGPVLDALLLEASDALRRCGEAVSRAAPVARVEWRAADISTSLAAGAARDLVCLTYFLSELPPDLRPKLIDELWS